VGGRGLRGRDKTQDKPNQNCHYESPQYNKYILIKKFFSWVPVAHACNLRYSGGRDQEGPGLKPALANSSQDPISRKPSQKKKEEEEEEFTKLNVSKADLSGQ
jgi:hypothetical protein